MSLLFSAAYHTNCTLLGEQVFCLMLVHICRANGASMIAYRRMPKIRLKRAQTHK